MDYSKLKMMVVLRQKIIRINLISWWNTRTEGITSPGYISPVLFLPGFVKNPVSKHFVIYLNFLCLGLFISGCLFYAAPFLDCIVVRDLCRSGCRQEIQYPVFPGIRDSGFDQNTVGDSGNVNGIWLQLEAGFSNAAGSRPRFQAFSILYDDR